MEFEWHLPTRIIFRAGAIDRVGEVIKGLGAQRVLLVTGGSAMRESGTTTRVMDLLSGPAVHLHEGVRVNLPLEDVDALIRSAREFEADLVVGMGGGSVLDGAKAAAWMAPHGGWVRDYLEGKSPGQGIPFVSVPTTSGTGSEVTPFIILMDAAAKRKLSLGPMAAAPRAAMVDPMLSLTLPPDQTASTGLDALSHGFEAYWSVRSNPISDALALEAVSVGLEHIERAFESPGDVEARTGMSYAAMVGGLALSQTATAAVHGLTYPLTVHYGVPHGMACAFLLREVLKINFYHLPAGKQKRLLHAMKSNTIGAAVGMLDDLFRALGVPSTMEELGVPEEEIMRFADEATPKNLERNVAPMDRARILEIWEGKKSGGRDS